MARPYAFSALLSLLVALPLHAGELPEASATDVTDTTALPAADALPPLADPDAPPMAEADDELQPPAIDAYFDVSFTRTDVGALGYDDTAGGYRFIAGFRLENVQAGAWSVAPEVGYFRIGKGELQQQAEFFGEISDYKRIRTDTFILDGSSLDFGARFSRELTAKTRVFARAGLGVTHVSRKQQTLDLWVPLPPLDPASCPPGGCALPTTTPSTTDVGLEPWGSAGVALQLGAVPWLYGEYGLRLLDGERIDTLAIGFLLDF